MSEIPAENPEKSFDPEQRINFYVPIEGGFEIQSENRLANMASTSVLLIRLSGDSLGEQEQGNLLEKAIHVDPKRGIYGSLEFNAWILHAMNDEERRIALSSVDDETREVLFKTMDEVVTREKAFQERVGVATREAQPKLNQLLQQIRERIQNFNKK